MYRILGNLKGIIRDTNIGFRVERFSDLLRKPACMTGDRETVATDSKRLSGPTGVF